MKKILLALSITLFVSCSSSDDSEPLTVIEKLSFEGKLSGKWGYTKRYYLNNSGQENLSQGECTLMRSYTLFETGNANLEYWGGNDTECEIWTTFTGDWAVATDPLESRHNIIFQLTDPDVNELRTSYAYADFISDDVLHLTFYPRTDFDKEDDFPIFKLHLERE